VTLRARWVTLRARWVTLRARWVTLRARWVTLRARWVTLKMAGWGPRSMAAEVEAAGGVALVLRVAGDLSASEAAAVTGPNSAPKTRRV
jgi:hypothetical protein